MIAFLRGSVAAVGPDSLVVDIGAVGMQVLCTPATALSVSVGENIQLQTTMIVREESLTLYGFVDADERAVFEQVQTVSGIGPRIALALLGSLTPDELRAAIATSNEASLTKVPGIGKKGAQRLILELRDRLGPATTSVSASSIGRGSPAAAGWQGSVQAALVSLGWSAKDAETAVAGLPADVLEAAGVSGAQPDISMLLKASLRSLDRP